MKDIPLIIFTSILLIINTININTSKLIKEKSSISPNTNKNKSNEENIEINNLISLEQNLKEFFKLKMQFSTNKNSIFFPFINNNNFRNNSTEKTNKFTLLNFVKKSDDYKFAKNITCTNENCKYPNICINKNTCSCDNRYANFFEENLNLNKEKNITPKNLIYCSYKRKSPVMVSIFEFIFPGAGLFYIGNYKYALIKFNIGFIFLILAIIRIYRIFNINIKKSKELIEKKGIFWNYKDKTKKENFFFDKNHIDKYKDSSIISVNVNLNNRKVNNNNYNNLEDTILIHNSNIDNDKISTFKQNKIKNKSQNFSNLDYALLIIGIILLIWLIVDFILIGLRSLPDENGVGLISFPV